MGLSRCEIGIFDVDWCAPCPQTSRDGYVLEGTHVHKDGDTGPARLQMVQLDQIQRDSTGRIHRQHRKYLDL